MHKLDALSAIKLGFTHDFCKSSMVQDFAFGGRIAKNYNHRL